MFNTERPHINNGQKSKQRAFFRLTQKTLIALLLLIGLQTTMSFTETGQAANDLSVVYHVYADGEYLGGLSKEDKLAELEKAKIEEAKADFNNLDLTIGSEVSVIPERVFDAEMNDDAVLEKLQETVVVKANALAVVINDKPVFYVKDEATYDEVVRNIKLQSVSEEELNVFEANLSSTESVPALEENETRIASINFSYELTKRDAEVLPDDVLTAEEALVLLEKGSLEDKIYEVQAGDVLGAIASKNDMSSEQLIALNPTYDDETILQIGDEFVVKEREPLVEIDVYYEAKKEKDIPFEKVTEEDRTLYKGNNTITQKGSDGKKLVTERILKKDGHVIGKTIEAEEILVEPISEVTVVGTKVIPSRGIGEFVWPTDGGYISSQMGQRWGRMHRGIDIARPASRTITVADNGVVKAAGQDGSYGNRIIVDHNNGYETLYAHLSSIEVKVGQVVPQGTRIGVMGSTGHSTGIHLHFEVKKNGSLINPVTVLK